MKPASTNWVLVVSKGGRRIAAFPMPDGVVTAGRDADNELPLPHSSVSRKHAEFSCDASGVAVRDLDSRNGILVNGVPRKRARLQAGDRVAICDFQIEVANAIPAETGTVTRPPALGAALEVQATLGQRLQLPEARADRQLATLYHACFWIAEGVEERVLNERCLQLITESLHAVETQLYSGGREFQAHVSDAGGKPSLKLAAFLAKHFQQQQEASVLLGRDLARHQRGVGDFNYLVCPLRPQSNGGDAAPFVVVLRSADQPDFTPEDRVLLQATCQLWARGQARTQQVTALRQENAQLKEKLSTGAMLGSSPAMTRLRERALKAAATNATVLITGETGSGKEVLAQFLHENSPRCGKPLVKLNCAAIPDTLIESELFGYAKGAFSGATRDHQGKFAQASGGTLFLDEIGEMPLLVQAKVLRAIENREVQPLGSDQTLTVDIRILAATNRDLADAVRQRQFREDLLYRLDVQSLKVPPLREREEDVPELARHFLRQFCATNGLAELVFAPAALEALKQHAWPGNIRELANVVQRCALNAASPTIAKAEVIEHGRFG